MHDGDPLRQRYLRWLKIGSALLALLAVPAAIHSRAAIKSLFNRPVDWVPDSLTEKAEFNDFQNHFSVSDLIMFGWEESELDSDSLRLAAAMLRPLCVDGKDRDGKDRDGENARNEIDDEMRDLLPSGYQDQIASIRQFCKTDSPLLWVRTGTETLDQLTTPPANLSRRAAVRRLQGTLIGPDGE